MHILLLAPGCSVHSRRFLGMLLTAGYRVTLVDAHDPLPEGAGGYTFVPYPDMYGLNRLGVRRVNHCGQQIIATRLRRIWERVRPDIVHLHWVDVRAEHCARARLHPLILSCWGSDINNLFDPEQEDAEYRQRIARAVAGADHILADSREVLERCDTLAGRKLNGSLAYFGIDLGRFRPGYAEEARALRKELGVPASARILLSVRALRPLMGHHHVLEAFGRLAQQPWADDVVLALKRYLPYADGYEESLRARIQEWKLEDRVFWLEPVENERMPFQYALADVVVNYPERDGFPVTFFEAAACRRSVVSSDLAAYQGVFGSDTFHWAPPGAAPALAESLSASLQMSESEREERLERAWKITQDCGGQQHCLAEVERVYAGYFSSFR